MSSADQWSRFLSSWYRPGKLAVKQEPKLRALTLPDVLAEWYSVSSAYQSALKSPGLRILGIEELSPSGGRLTVCVNEELNEAWGIDYPPVDMTDPVIKAFVLGGGEERALSRSSIFFIELLRYKAVHSPPGKESLAVYWGRRTKIFPRRDDSLRMLRASFGEVKTKLPYSARKLSSTWMTFFEAGDAIVSLHGTKEFPEVRAVAKTPDAWDTLTEIMKKNGGGWGILYVKGPRGWKRTEGF